MKKLWALLVLSFLLTSCFGKTDPVDTPDTSVPVDNSQDIRVDEEDTPTEDSSDDTGSEETSNNDIPSSNTDIDSSGTSSPESSDNNASDSENTDSGATTDDTSSESDTEIVNDFEDELNSLFDLLEDDAK